jgi:Acyclic terpene utilisation family protein AtuA
MTVNAYLGARPIAMALDAGADVVVTGRCADAAVVLGPLLHEFGWSDEDYDLLSTGMLAGHILECGPQATGGLFTDWWAVPGWDDMGYPIAECRRDGAVVITKPEGTGGFVTPATVGEQILYEIGDPGAYVVPDVVCDWRAVQLEQEGPDRVRVTGAKGRPPTTTFKCSVTHVEGYRALMTALFAGYDAAGRARRAGEAMVTRSERLAGEAGLARFDETSIEVVGSGDLHGWESATDAAVEVVLKVGVRHRDRGGAKVFSAECMSLSLVAQGMTGVFGGRPRVAPVIRVFHLLVPKSVVSPTVRIGAEAFAVDISRGHIDHDEGTPALAEPDAGGAPPAGRTVPLRRLAYGRSGDKGDQVNIGLIARRPEFRDVIKEQVTAARVSAFFHHYLAGREVRRWELPGLGAINIVLPDVLGGMGGTSTLRYDTQGKSYAAMLLTLPVTVPAEWDGQGLLGG